MVSSCCKQAVVTLFVLPEKRSSSRGKKAVVEVEGWGGSGPSPAACPRRRSCCHAVSSPSSAPTRWGRRPRGCSRPGVTPRRCPYGNCRKREHAMGDKDSKGASGMPTRCGQLSTGLRVRTLPALLLPTPAARRWPYGTGTSPGSVRSPGLRFSFGAGPSRRSSAWLHPNGQGSPNPPELGHRRGVNLAGVQGLRAACPIPSVTKRGRGERGLYLRAAPTIQLILGARLHPSAGPVRLGGGCSRAGDGVRLLPFTRMGEKPLPSRLPPAFAFHSSSQPLFSSAAKALEKLQLGGEGGRAQPAPSKSPPAWISGGGVIKPPAPPAFVSRAGAAGAAAASQTPPGRASPGTSRALPASRSPPSPLGAAFPPHGRSTGWVQPAGLTGAGASRLG